MLGYELGLAFRASCKKCEEDRKNNCLHIEQKYNEHGCYRKKKDYLFNQHQGMALTYVMYEKDIRNSLFQLRRDLVVSI